MYMSRKKRRRIRPTMPEISLTPLIDTALTLLVIFMIATPMMHNGLKVDLPQSSVNEFPGGLPQELVIDIDAQEHIALNGRPIKDGSLAQELQKELKGRSNQVVSLKGDSSITYKKLIEVYNEIQEVGGIKHVALATKRAPTKTRTAV